MSHFSTSVIITTITKTIKVLINVLTTVIIANNIGPEGQGIYKIALLISGLLIAFGNFGLGQSIIYFYNQNENNRQQIINSSLTLSIILSVLLIIIGNIIIRIWGNQLFPGVDEYYLLIGLISVPFLFINSIIGAVFLAQKNAKLYNLTGVLNLLMFLIFLTAFYFLNILNTHLTILGYVLTSIISFIYLIISFYSRGNKFRPSFDLRLYYNSLKYGIKVFLSGLINFLHYRIDAFIINALISPASVGIYSIATTLGEKTWIVSQSFGEMIFPKTASSKSLQDSISFTIRVFKFVIIITFLIAVVLFFLSGPIIKFLFSEEYNASVVPFKILLIGTISIAGWRILVNDLFGRNIITPTIILSLFSVVLNIVLNILLIKNLGIKGAAIASSITYTISLIGIMSIYCYKLNICFLVLLQLRKEDFIQFKPLLNKLFVIPFKLRKKT